MLRLRLTVIYGVLLFLALVLSGTAVVTVLRYRLTMRLDDALDQRLAGIQDFLLREVTPSHPETIPFELAEYASAQPEGRWLEVRDRQGVVLLKAALINGPVRRRARSFELFGVSYDSTAAASERPIDESVQEIQSLLLWSTPVLMVLIGLSGYWISSRSLRPVDEMTAAARMIGASNLSGRLPLPPARDELRRLAEAWNEMLGRLDESFSRMQRFTADAAHELRTPLATLRTTAELALRRPRDPQEYREALAQVVSISERMQQLSDGLLAVARGDHPVTPVAIARVDLAGLVRGIAAEMGPLFADRDLRLEVTVPPAPAVLSADADGLRRVMAVLLDNARKYTSPGGRVSMMLEERPEEFCLSVTDSGCGIPQEALSRVFDRFYRVDSSRDRQTGGYGLGLAIAQQIARAHQGQIEAESVLGTGSTFRLRLPKQTG